MLLLQTSTKQTRRPAKFFAIASASFALAASSSLAAIAANTAPPVLAAEPEFDVEQISEKEQYFEGAKPESVDAVNIMPAKENIADIVAIADIPDDLEEEKSAYEYEESYDDGDYADSFNENFLLLQVTADGKVLSRGLSSYQVDERLYISLFELVDTVYFPIEVFDEEQTAEGWFATPDNDFYLDLKQNSLIVAGREKGLDKNDYRMIDEEIYISSDAIKKWFGISFDLNFSRQTLNLQSNETLAFEAAEKRQEKWRKAKSVKRGEIKSYDKLDVPYKLAEIPSSTVILNGNYSDSGDEKITAGSYSLQGSGDLLGMSADYFISGNDEETVNDSRLRLYRYDDDGVIDGTDIRQLEIGDITPARLNLAGSGGTERGVKITNKSLGEITSPDNLIIDGEVEPGYEVELYRNGEFLAFLSAAETSNGRFEFTGLTLDGGLNLFKIVKYGPFGEKEEEFRRYFIGSGLLKEGELKYEVSATQVGLAFLPNTSEDYELSGAQRIVGSFDYGVTRDFSVGAGIYSGPILDENRNAALLSSRASLLGTYNILDHLAIDDGSSITAFSNRMSFADFNISSFATYYNGFDQSELDTTLDSSVDVSTNFDLFGLTNLTVRVGGEYEEFQSNQTRYGYNNQVSTVVQGFALSNRLDWDITEIAGTETTSAFGEFFFRKRFDSPFEDDPHEILLRTNLLYSVEPEKTLDSLTLTAEKNLDEDLRMRLSYAESFGASNIKTYGLGLNYSHDYFLIGANASYDSNDSMAIGLNLRFNVGPDYQNGGIDFIKNEQAQRGSVEAAVYLDNNHNSKYDEGDEPIEGVELKSRFGSRASTNENGIAFMHGFAGYKTDDITLDYTSLPDIFYVPIKDGYRIVPRPGNTAQIEFPVVLGGEVEGQLSLHTDLLNNSFDFSKFTLELLNEDGEVVKETRSDQMGYYLFERVIPKTYTIRIKADSIAETGYTGQTEQEFTMDPQDPVVTDLNFSGALPDEENEEDTEENEEVLTTITEEITEQNVDEIETTKTIIKDVTSVEPEAIEESKEAQIEEKEPNLVESKPTIKTFSDYEGKYELDTEIEELESVDDIKSEITDMQSE